MSRSACRAPVLALWLALLSLLSILALPAAAQTMAAQVAVPPLQSHVTDLVGMLQPDQRTALDNTLSEYETRTGSQIAILLLSKTEPEGIEDYAVRVADAWKLGRKGIDDGVILLVAKDNPKALRRMMILTGRGVQGTLTDAQSKRVLQDIIAPYFSKGDFYGGLTAGISAIMPLLDQENFAPPSRKAAQAQEPSSDLLGALAPLLFFGFIILITIISRARGGGAGSGRSLNSNVWGNAAGVIIGSILSQGGRGGGGFGGGGGSFGGGGGFSGGGGGFDGGGASGDW
ncbi:Beta-propeller domains of methanol dehydrogenase type [Collimonas arenae]|uniref:Beta-propeller domains of methanol dehydrogenase type n=1 Tax=Collimonas arenae TaxID=279058 RepID=A0A0A1FF69_9BURK|nr:TPM domain-containing protein [Collimonas arenae]AIY43398.1 Beta-propeller domains of methanol dehydrogenase type [Collimonas arenae]